MKNLILPACLAITLLASGQDMPIPSPSPEPSVQEKINNCLSERKILRDQILASRFFAQFKSGKSGDEIEALIYSVGNFLTDGTDGEISSESALQKEGRRLASDANPDDDGVRSLKAYIKNRNLLNSLYAQRRQATLVEDPR